MKYLVQKVEKCGYWRYNIVYAFIQKFRKELAVPGVHGFHWMVALYFQ